MANISFDGQSFSIDGRREWLVSGAIHYARVPEALWRDRIRAARQAGLNTIQTSVFWHQHEPQPGVFRFEGQHDLRRFVEMIAEEGMRCVLRPGPFVNAAADMGGLPPWLLGLENVALREGNPAFLQATARYLDAVMAQVRDLQVTEPTSGPLVLVQVEHEWFCHHEKQAEKYLQQVNRFLRESGCAVPLVNTNNLWQQVAGTLDGWVGDENIFGNCRQLRVLQPDGPCVVMSLPTGKVDAWDEPARDARPGDQLLVNMAKVSAAGAMFNLDPFHGGTNLGYQGARLLDGDHRFTTTSFDSHAPLSETGGRTAKYGLVKRLCTFLDSFSSLMSHLKTGEHHTVAAGGTSIIQQSGSQGDVVFIVREPGTDKGGEVELITPDGQNLPVPLGKAAAQWLVLKANLGGTATLDLTNLTPFAFVEKQLLVLYGPAGSEGLVSVDSGLHSVPVPKGAEPTLIAFDDLHVAVLNEQQVDAAYVDEDGLWIGVDGLDADGKPRPHDEFATYCRVDLQGQVTKHRRGRNGKRAAIKLNNWQAATTKNYATGDAPRFATLDGPRSLEACGADFGYGWYRVRMKRSRSKKVNLLAPDAGDRLHLYLNGKLKSVVGLGPGAKAEPLALTLPSGEVDLVVLADNMGRFCEDRGIDWPKGLYGDLLDVKALRLGKVTTEVGPRVDPFKLAGFVPWATVTDRDRYPRHSFKFTQRSVAPIVVTLRGERPRSVVLINDEPVALDLGRGVAQNVVIDEHLKRGSNTLTLATIDHAVDGFDFRGQVEAHTVVDVLTEEASFWYARWQMPDAPAYKPLAKAVPNLPTFYRTSFEMKQVDGPWMLEITRGTKGQIYLNGHNVGRYFVATSTGTKVGPQTQYYLPEPWLTTDEPNELVLFDEHGNAPTCRIVPAE
ncbi:MAG: beta-galactosidase [Phycisphaeraceae bacterium]